MRKRALVSLASLLALAVIGPSASRGEVARVDSASSHRIEVGEIRVEPAKHEDRHRVLLDGWARSEIPGAPDLPARRLLVALPSGTTPAVRALVGRTRTLEGVAPLPTPFHSDPLDSGALPGSPPTGTYREGAAYLGKGPFPSEWATVEWVGSLGGVPVASVRVVPCRYIPGVGLQIADSIDLVIDFLPSDGEKPGTLHPDRISPAAAELARRAVLNPERLVAPDPARGAPGGVVSPSSRFSSPRVKIFVDQDAFYEVTQSDLIAAGADPGSSDTATFRLEAGGSEVAILMEDGGDGTFDSGDRLLFYGQGMTGRYTRENVYWLDWGDTPGLRIADRDVTPSGTLPQAQTYDDTVRREINSQFWQTAPGDLSLDRWFESKTSIGASSDYTIDLQDRDAAEPNARLRVMLMGRTDTSSDPDHHTRILLNGTQVDEQMWEGQVPFLHDISVDATLLLEGTNTVTVHQPGLADPSLDTIYFNWLELDYSDSLVAENDTLEFELESVGLGNEIRVDGFSTNDVSVFDITDPVLPVRLTGVDVALDVTDYRARFEQTGAGVAEYLAQTATHVASPNGFLVDTTSDLVNPANGADLIIITHAEFRTAADRLALHRSSTDGLRVVVADVQDVYDEFSDGVFNPEALSDFVAFALTSWQAPAPTSLLLVGDANQDHLDNFQTGSPDWVPARLVMTPGAGETPTDNLYAAVLGSDPLPDIVVGRMAARSLSDADAMVDKTIAYETSPPASPLTVQSLFVADNYEQIFEDMLDALISDYLPPAHTPRRVYLGDYGSTSGARDAIRQWVDDGVMMTTYAGHGAVEFWAAEYLFHRTDVASLANGPRQTFVVMLNCVNFYYPHSFKPYSHAEEWVRWLDRGAVFAWGTLSYGTPESNAAHANRLFEQVFDLGEAQAGLAAHTAKILAYTLDGTGDEQMHAMHFLGDPSARMTMDRDGDGVIDDTDNCPLVGNTDQNDDDLDGIGDLCDVCPLDYDNDVDGDGVCGDVDNCPAASNPAQTDTDGDGAGNVCDSDDDEDGIDDEADNCPLVANAGQADADVDGIGDVCDACPLDPDNDVDGDGICGDLDNCTWGDPPHYDFESGPEGWTSASRGAADTWHLADETCYGDPFANTMYVSNGNAGPGCTADSSHEHSQILGPAIALPTVGPILLKFDTLSYDEFGSCIASGDYDAHDVGLTTDGGSSYTLLNDCTPLALGVGFLLHREYDVSAFAGQTAQPIFVYETVDEIADHTFAVDNVTFAWPDSANPGQENWDGDPLGDVCDPDDDNDGANDESDCAVLDPALWSVPSDPGTIVFPDATNLTWSASLDPGGLGTVVYDTIRSEDKADWLTAPFCVESDDGADTTAMVSGEPSLGGVYFYLVRAENGCGGLLGQDSTGDDRVGGSCP